MWMPSCPPSVVDVEEGGLLAVALGEEEVLQGHPLAMLQARQLAHEGWHIGRCLPGQLRDDGALRHQAPRQHVARLRHVHLHSAILWALHHCTQQLWQRRLKIM